MMLSPPSIRADRNAGTRFPAAGTRRPRGAPGRFARARWRIAAALALAISQVAAPAAEPRQQTPRGDEIPLTVGRSIVLDVPDEIQRVAITDDRVADAVAISTREVLINATGQGLTTLVLWTRSGDRNFFTIKVNPDVEQIQDHIRAALPGEDIRVMASQGVVTLTGRASSPEMMERALAMATGLNLGAVVNNIELPTPPAERQIMIKVRFIEVSRNWRQELGVNIISTGAGNTRGTVSTQQFGPVTANSDGTFNLTDPLNIIAFRPDHGFTTIIKALESRGLGQILAEPNLVTTSGKQADLLIGGEFPVPVVQGGSTAGAVTIQYREFGIRIAFLPVLTPRGTIQMHIRPEVSTLDFANAVQFSGFLIPALSTRRVETDVELQPGQSFVIGGLIDNRVIESFNKIPGLSAIPLIGNLFKSRSLVKNNSELIVVVTPEFPKVIEVGEELPNLPVIKPFMPSLQEEAEYERKKRERKK